MTARKLTPEESGRVAFGLAASRVRSDLIHLYRMMAALKRAEAKTEAAGLYRAAITELAQSIRIASELGKAIGIHTRPGEAGKPAALDLDDARREIDARLDRLRGAGAD